VENREMKIALASVLAGLIVGAALGSIAGEENAPPPQGGMEAVSSSSAGDEALGYVNERILGPRGFQGEVNSTEDYGEMLYQVNIDILRGGEKFDTQPVWVTRDGELLALNVVNMSQPPQEEEEAQKTNLTGGDPYLGPGDAKVVIIGFSDYQCPFCKKFSDEVLPRILENYEGEVKYVFKDFPLERIHSQAFNASVAAYCAGEQEDYFEFHDLLFENVNQWSKSGNFDPYAREMGLDLQDFNSCLNSQKAKQEVEGDIEEGLDAGVRSTPTFFVNGIEIQGAQPYERFREVIESELE